MVHKMLTVSVLAIVIMAVGVSAKRGCSAFGHSCFGGHGKRSDSTLDTTNGDAIGPRQLGQEEIPRHPIYPHPYGMLPSGDDIIPVRDGAVSMCAGAFERDRNNARDAMKMKLRNILRYWMDYYRRSRQNNDDGYSFETL